MDDLELFNSELAILPQLKGRVNRKSAYLLSKVWLDNRYRQLEELWRREAPPNGVPFEEVRRKLGLVGRSSLLFTDISRCGIELAFPLENGDTQSVKIAAQYSQVIPRLLESLFKRSAQPTFATIAKLVDKITRLEAVHRQLIDALTDSGCLSYMASLPWNKPWDGQQGSPKETWLNKVLDDETFPIEGMIEAFKNVAYDRASFQLVQKTIAAAQEKDVSIYYAYKWLLQDVLNTQTGQGEPTWLQALVKRTKTMDDFLPVAIDKYTQVSEKI